MQTPTRISVLVERVGDWWVAQCVEHDLATQVRSVHDLHDEIQRLLISHISSAEELGNEPFDLPPAPPEVAAKFERSKTRVEHIGTMAPRLVTNHEPPIAEIRLA
jgi:hypothetical protein